MARYTRDEVEVFRERQRRAWYAAFTALMFVAIAVAFAIAAVGPFLIGLLAAFVVALVGFEGLRRWNRVRWLRHFPELHDHSFSWVNDAP